MKSNLLIAAAALAIAGCNNAAPVAPPFANRFTGPPSNPNGITVMTRNIDEGANLDPILLATDPNQVPVAVGQIFGEMTANNFPERAGALAREIASTRPQLIGLQEVALWRVQTGPNPFTPATTVAFDYLDILLDSLRAQGVQYDSVAAQVGGDVQLPGVVSVNPLTIIGVRLTEREAIIARKDVAVHDATSGNYQAAVAISLGATIIFEKRNWVSVRATVGKREIRFVTTHLTQQRNEAVQLAQAQELITLLADEQDPLILTGDFNSAADGSQTPTYGILLAVGYRDLWSDRFPRAPGYTCCAADDLHDATVRFDQRLDLVLVHDPRAPNAGGIVGLVRADIVGDTPSERTVSGLWPSDHAGVVASLLLPPVEHP